MTNTKVVSIEENGLTVEKQDKTAETVLRRHSHFRIRNKTFFFYPVDAVKAKYHLKTRVVGDSDNLGKIGKLFATFSMRLQVYKNHKFLR